MFDQFSGYKKIIYESFAAALGPMAIIDCCLFNNDVDVFGLQLQLEKEGHSHYVILPHFNVEPPKAAQLLNQIPKQKLVLVDLDLPGVVGEYAAICQNFLWDIYEALRVELMRANRYRTIKLVFAPTSFYPRDIQRGVQLFCEHFGFYYQLVDDPARLKVDERDLFIVVSETHLVPLLERVDRSRLVLGKQVGVISYNEGPMKDVLYQGITTVSADFRKMGEMAAEAVLQNRRDHRNVPFGMRVKTSF